MNGIEGPDYLPSTVAVSPSNQIVYIGGTFSAVGPRTDSFAVVDGTSAELLENVRLDKFDAGSTDEVWAVIPDGDGGWFVAGESFLIEVHDLITTSHSKYVRGDGATKNNRETL